MRKICVWLLLAVLLTGCGEAPAPEVTQPEAAAVQTAQILPTVRTEQKEYEGVVLSLSCPDGSDSPEAEVISQAAAVFEARTGAKIFFSPETEGKEDIIAIEGEELSGRAEELLELTAFASASDYEAHSYPFLRQQVIKRCGSLKAIPWEPELWGVYYNTEVFAACGLTETPAIWEDFMAICGVLKNAGYEVMALDEQKAVMATTMHLERGFGWDGLKGLNRNNPELIRSLQQIIDFLNRGYFSGGWPEDTASLQTRIAFGNTAMFVGSDKDCALLEDAMEADLSWGVFPWPGTGTGTGCAADSRVLGVSRNCGHPQAAFDFIMLLTTGEFDQLRTDLTGRLPADPRNEALIVDGTAVLTQAAGAADVLPGNMPLAIWKSSYKSGEKAAQKWVSP